MTVRDQSLVMKEIKVMLVPRENRVQRVNKVLMELKKANQGQMVHLVKRVNQELSVKTALRVQKDLRANKDLKDPRALKAPRETQEKKENPEQRRVIPVNLVRMVQRELEDPLERLQIVQKAPLVWMVRRVPKEKWVIKALKANQEKMVSLERTWLDHQENLVKRVSQVNKVIQVLMAMSRSMVRSVMKVKKVPKENRYEWKSPYECPFTIINY